MLLIKSPYQQFFDADGSPLDNGNIYIGAVGANPETNPLVVYYDEAGTLPVSQPIKTLNGFMSRAGSPALVYINAENYSITIKDKNGQLVASALNALSQPTITGATGSSLIGFSQAGGITRTVQTELRETVKVTQFAGADPTGATSSLAAFNAAGSVAAKVEVHIPAGVWNLSANPTPTGDVVWVIHTGATFTGAGKIIGKKTVSYSDNTPSDLSTIYNAAWAYMIPSSTELVTARTGGLGVTAYGVGTNTVAANASISFSAIQANNSTTGASSWCYYASTVGEATSASSRTHCAEFDVTALSTDMGITYGLAINVGGELCAQIGAPYVFKNASAALLIAQNNPENYPDVQFANGIVFAPNALNSQQTAIKFSQNNAMRWFDDPTGAISFGSIYNSVTSAANALSLGFTDNGLFVQTTAGNNVFQVGKSTTPANWIQINSGETGQGAELRTNGADGVVDLKIIPKGGGLVSFGTFTGGALSATGFITVRDSAGTIRRLLVG